MKPAAARVPVRLRRSYEAEALEYLARAPYDNVFLSWIIANDRSTATRSSIALCGPPDEPVRGVAYYGRQVVLAADDGETVDAFAASAPISRLERMIVGPKPIADRYWERVRDRHAPARAIRDRQPVLAVDRATLVTPHDAPPVRVRRARPGEWERVAYNSAKMIEQELEYDPRGFAAEFNANVRLMIDRGLWWVGETEGELCFFCNAGPRTAQTLQLQGIWTPPALRGRGLAASALAGISEILLRDVPSLSLYVNGFNVPALRLYERTGFRQVSEFSTYLF